MTAIVGESGAGKSTVLDLILRLYDPTAGAILADGIPLPEYDQKAWRNLIGMVNQDIHIFNASIHQNIAFRRPDADREEVERAARIANAHEFILELPNGYDTVVGERGMRLSGGQRQRIAIARAVLHDAPILILDEATSELDSHIERKIQESIARLSSDRTIIAVAHRLSTISMADQILVLESGRLVEQGTHSELLDLSGIYASLWRIQSQSEEKVRK
jgi:ABC-type multidrug transport system fused ATPase/permease subunit